MQPTFYEKIKYHFNYYTLLLLITTSHTFMMFTVINFRYFPNLFHDLNILNKKGSYNERFRNVLYIVFSQRKIYNYCENYNQILMLYLWKISFSLIHNVQSEGGNAVRSGYPWKKIYNYGYQKTLSYKAFI